MNTDDRRCRDAGVCTPFLCFNGRLLPRCHDALTELPPGLYLTLFHGRDDPDADMDDWGFDGPVIGPLDYVHTTYATDIKLRFIDRQPPGISPTPGLSRTWRPECIRAAPMPYWRSPTT